MFTTTPRRILSLLLGTLFLTVPALALADTIVLNDGSSYSGQFAGAGNGEITFTDNQGVQYRFPFVTLRDSKVYSGHYTGTDPLSFNDNQGIGYQFPVKDVASLVFSRGHAHAPSANPTGGASKVIPEGTEITIRTDEKIDSDDSSPGQLFSATVNEEVLDAMGGIAIASGTQAKLVVRNITSGGATHSPELVLDLFSISLNGKEYRVVTSDVDFSNKKGIGANKRTAEFGGGGAAIGALLGGIFGGGKGAGIGAATGAGGGLLTQLFTRGKKVKVPAETALHFRLDRTLVLRQRAAE
jgi:hypothetical protein